MKTFLRPMALALLLTVGFCATAQNIHNEYSWTYTMEKPAVLTAAEKEEPHVYLKDVYLNVYALERNVLVRYVVIHRHVAINKPEGVDRFNTLKFQAGSKDLKLRIRKADGTVKDMEDKDFIEEHNEGTMVKKIAIEGLTTGSEVEYYFIYRAQMSYWGHLAIQKTVPVRYSKFAIYSPKYLKFETKSHNGFPDMKDSLDEANEQRIRQVVLKDIVPLEDEDYAFTDAQSMRVEYALAYNTNNPGIRLLQYADAGKSFYNRMWPTNKSEQKVLKKMVVSMKIPPNATMEEKVRAVENHIKKNYKYSSGIWSDAIPITTFYNSKFTNEASYIRMYAQIFQYLDIPFQFALTSDRTERPFDSEFESWGYLEEVFIYLPKLDMYLAPTHTFYRLGRMPAAYTDNDALFIEEVKLGETGSGLAKVKRIPPQEVKANYHNMALTVRLSDDLEKAIVESKHAYAGQEKTWASIYKYIDDDKKEELLKGIVKLGDEEATVKTVSSNDIEQAIEDDKPVELTAEIELVDLVEFANNTLIVKMGELIGQQAEMYAEKKRVYPIQIRYPHSYERIITFIVPEGYEVEGLEKLNSNVAMKGTSGTQAFFVSSYKLEGNKLTITIQEAYNHTSYPIERINEYRAVINAAADFNKVKLLLKKKG